MEVVNFFSVWTVETAFVTSTDYNKTSIITKI